MALHRATQSAVWYYASCMPCATARYKKQLHEKSEGWRAEREMMVAADPTMYQHPSPNGTNPYWQYEIETGPHVVAKRKKKNTSDTQRRRPRTTTSATDRSNISNDPSSLDLSSRARSMDGRDDSQFDFKQYQRDDEQMWGIGTVEILPSDVSLQSSRITKPAKAHVRGGDHETSYANYRNPQLNDLHPATVTKINSREEARWIFQPLPNAEVMKGSERNTARSRSDSGVSSRMSARSPVLSGRDVSHRNSPPVSRGSSHRTPNYISMPIGRQEDATAMESRDFASTDDDNERPATRASPKLRVTDESEESAIIVLRSASVPPEGPSRQTSRLATKPQLSTILSDSVGPSDEDSFDAPDDRPKEQSNSISHHSDNTTNLRDRTSRRSAHDSKDDSLKVLQELAPSSAIFNTAVVSTDDLASAPTKAERLASQTSNDPPADIDPDILENWDSADFELPQWIHEHTKREVRERWSMDI